MGTRFSTVHAGRRIEVEPSGSWTGTTVRLLVDGQEVARAKGAGASRSAATASKSEPGPPGTANP